MSNLPFTASEIRLATLGLASNATLLPILYAFWPAKKQTSNQDIRIQTFNTFLESYSTLRPEALTCLASPDFSHAVLPLSLNLPSRTLAPFQQHATQVFSLFSSFCLLPVPNGADEAIHFSPDTDTVIAHCKMGGKVNAQSEMGGVLGLEEWWTECVLFVRMSEDGKRIVEVREFVDSKKAEELRLRLSAVFE
jgi:hypothetical protein